MSGYRIPVYRPLLAGNEASYVNDCLQSSWISSKGQYVERFESEFATRIGVSHAATTCNGTTALHLALLALGLGPGDEVIVPTLTYVAPVNAITYTGAAPVFADCHADTWTVDAADVRKRLSPRTRAIMVVHLYGQACEMDAILDLAHQHGLFVIEDCAEAFGTIYRGRHVGALGDIGTFSFYGNKTITCGEGGMIVSNDKTLMARARHFKGQGLADHREYWHDVVGYNYRMTNIAAAIGLAQLEQADRFIARKRKIAALYQSGLSDIKIGFQSEAAGTIHSYWMISILVEQPEQRDELRRYLGRAGIETRPVFFPVHTMPMYAKSYRKHTVSEDIAWRGINLPSYPGMTDDEVNDVVEAIHGFFG